MIELRRDGGVERIELEPVDSYRLELENLADAIAGDAPLLLGREDALGQARAIEALFRSARDAGRATSALARHLEVAVHRARVRVALEVVRAGLEGDVPRRRLRLADLASPRRRPAGEVEVVDVGLVVDLDRVVTGRERRDGRSVLGPSG